MKLRIGKSEFAAGVAGGVAIGASIVAIGLLVGPKWAHLPAAEWLNPPDAIESQRLPAAALPVADLRGVSASREVREVADWVAESRDAAGMDFLIIDKRNAKLFVFDADARLRGATPILIGSAVGDETVPGIGSKPIPEVLPEERTTPAGRFVGERGRNTRNEDVVWVDYDAAVSMHRVLTTNPAERRLERLASAAVDDNRISYGCINVPVEFFEQHVSPTFNGRQAVIYVLPEVKALEHVFASYRPPAARPQATRLLQVSQLQGG